VLVRRVTCGGVEKREVAEGGTAPREKLLACALCRCAAVLWAPLK